MTSSRKERKPVRTDKQIADLKPEGTRYTVRDRDLRGHYVRVTPAGVKSFTVVARDPYGEQRWQIIGTADVLKIEEAREKAREVIKRIKAGETPVEAPPPKPASFEAVAREYIERHVKAKKLRSQAGIERIFERHILPTWGDREFVSIRRGDIARLLDSVKDAHGVRTADYVLALVGAVMRWQATRIDDYTPPVVKGMRLGASRQRDRVLNDDEIRIVWKVAENAGTYGGLIRVALLTGQRREKLATMRWEDIKTVKRDNAIFEGVWVIKSEEREKGTGDALALPEAVLAIIRAQRRIVGNPFVFPGRRDHHFCGWSSSKATFDRKVAVARGEAGPLPPWVFHDLRRTARTLLSREEVTEDIGEMTLGHVVGGIRATYDIYHYMPQKADALRRLATKVQEIVTSPDEPPADRVILLNVVHEEPAEKKTIRLDVIKAK